MTRLLSWSPFLGLPFPGCTRSRVPPPIYKPHTFVFLDSLCPVPEGRRIACLGPAPQHVDYPWNLLQFLAPLTVSDFYSRSLKEAGLQTIPAAMCFCCHLDVPRERKPSARGPVYR